MTDLDSTNPLDGRFIDQIVDGDLTPAELKNAIDRLDRAPDGWRRCGLAFLEAQCWRESFGALDEPAGLALARSSPATTAPVVAAKSRRHWFRGPGAAAMVAASFAIGWFGHAARPWPGATPTSIARPSASPVDSPDNIATFAGGDQPAAQPRYLPVRAERGFREIPTAGEVVRAVGRVRLGATPNGPEVPILTGPGIDEQWLKNQPPPLTEHGQVALQRQGYHVDQSRRLVSTTLPDGRRVTIPIDQVQIRYVGNNPL